MRAVLHACAFLALLAAVQSFSGPEGRASARVAAVRLRIADALGSLPRCKKLVYAFQGDAAGALLSSARLTDRELQLGSFFVVVPRELQTRTALVTLDCPGVRASSGVVWDLDDAGAGEFELGEVALEVGRPVTASSAQERVVAKEQKPVHSPECSSSEEPAAAKPAVYVSTEAEHADVLHASIAAGAESESTAADAMSCEGMKECGEISQNSKEGHSRPNRDRLRKQLALGAILSVELAALYSLHSLIGRAGSTSSQS